MFCQPGFEYFRRVLAIGPGNYLEIGVFNGDSIAALAREFANKSIFGIDPFIEDGCTTHTTQVQKHDAMPVQRANTLANIQGLPNIELFEMTSLQFAQSLTHDLVASLNVAWVLIDGSHHYADVQSDVDLAMRLIGDKTGSIVFDDVNLPGVAAAYQYFLKQYSGRYAAVEDLYALHPGHILAHTINPQG
jgi:predicted O-methyltransferase YrrM